MAVTLTEIAEAGAPPAAVAAPLPVPAAPPAPAAPVSVERLPPAIAEMPTQKGPRGILFDFNDGCRVAVPEAAHPWRVRLSDLDTGNVLFDTELKGGRINSTKRYYVRFRLEVWQQGESVFVHEYSAADREVLIRFPVDTVGDPLAWFSYAVRFKERHRCRLTCTMNHKMIALLRGSYPDITFLNETEAPADRFYATYGIAVYYKGGELYDHKDAAPSDFRRVGLHRAAGYILGVDTHEAPPNIVLPDDTRPIAEPYVCIAVQSTQQAKYWNNPGGWDEIIRFLKAAGYRVFCIDLKRTNGQGLVWNHMPAEAEDLTGDRPLIERARWLKHAEFFVGLSSGLSWLAWTMRTPTVLISGMTHPTNEFVTPYRVINYHACNSCWNDPLAPYDRTDYLTCARHKNTPRQFECTRLITAEQVKQTIRRIPGFGAGQRRVA